MTKIERDPDAPLIETEPGEQPSSPAQPGTLEQTGFKWGEGSEVPEYLRGKSAEETQALFETTVKTLQNMYEQQVNTQAQAQAPTYQAQPAATTMPDIISDQAGWEQQFSQQMAYQQQAMLNQAATPVYQQLSDAAERASRGEKDLERVWDRYGTEIRDLIVRVPVYQRNKELYDQAAKMIKGNHIEDIVEERVQALAGEGTGIVHDGTHSASFTPTRFTSEEDTAFELMGTTAFGRHMMETLDRREIIKNVEKTGRSLKEYAQSVAKTNAIINPLNAGEWTNKDLGED